MAQAVDLFTGVFIPRLVLEDARLSPAARILFGALDGLARTERGCWASSQYLCGICGMKPRQLRNLLADLERLGYISRTLTGRNTRTIYTVTTRALEGVGGRQKIAGGVGKKLPPYSKEDKLNTPQPPCEGGEKVLKHRGKRRRAMRLTKEDFARGF